MQNPNTQKNYSKQAMQKRLSGKDNNKNQGNNNINKLLMIINNLFI